MHWTVLTSLFVVLVLYLTFGGVVFHYLEHEHEEQTRIDTHNFTEHFLRLRPCVSENDLDGLVRIIIAAYENGIKMSNDTTHQPHWDLPSSMFFAMTVVSTIGYGHIAPATVEGRIFFIFFAIIGIPLCLVAMAAIGQCMMNQAKRLDKKLSMFETNPRLYKVLRSVLIFGCGLLLFILIPAVIFRSIEGWSYGTSVYYGVVTLSTVGFGDYVAGLEHMADGSRAVYRLGVGLWIFIGLTWLAIVFSSIQESIQDVVDKADKIRSKKKGDDKRKPKREIMKPGLYFGDDSSSSP